MSEEWHVGVRHHVFHYGKREECGMCTEERKPPTRVGAEEIACGACDEVFLCGCHQDCEGPK